MSQDFRGEQPSDEFSLAGSPAEKIPCFFMGEPTDLARGCLGCPALSEPQIKDGLFIGKTGVQLDLRDLVRMGPEPDPKTDASATKMIKPEPLLSRRTREKIRQEHQRRADRGLDGTCAFVGSVATCWRQAQ